jgi:hypothetical protein
MGGSQAQNRSSRPFSKAVRLTTPHGERLTNISQQVRHLRPLQKSFADSAIEQKKDENRLVTVLVPQTPVKTPVQKPSNQASYSPGLPLLPSWRPVLNAVAKIKFTHHLRADRLILGRVSAVLTRERNRLCLFVFSLFSSNYFIDGFC